MLRERPEDRPAFSELIGALDGLLDVH